MYVIYKSRPIKSNVALLSQILTLLDLHLSRRKYLPFLLYKNDEQYNYLFESSRSALPFILFLLFLILRRVERPFTHYFIFNIFNFKEKSPQPILSRVKFIAHSYKKKKNLLHRNCFTQLIKRF